MSEQITQKVLIDLEVKKAKEEMRELAKNSGDAKTAMAALDARAKELEKSLNAIKQAGGRLAPEFKALGNLATAFNQGLELAGKALRFAEEGLDAYAKTSARAAADVRKLTGEFAYYKKVVMEGVGEAAVALGQSAVNFDQAVEALRRGGEKGFGKAYGQISKEWDGINLAIKDTAMALKGLGENEMQRFGEITGRVAGNAQKRIEALAAAAVKLQEEYKKLGKALLGPGVRKESHRAGMTAEEEREIQEANARYQVDLDEATTSRRAVDYGAAMQSLSESGSALADMQNALAKLQDPAARERTLFESIFGPVSEIDLYKQSLEALGGVMDGFTAAVGAGYQAIVTGSQPIGQAMKAAAAASILATGTASAIDAARETALGFGALAWGPIGGVSAAAHFKSAALHAAVAVGAGVAAKGLGAGSAAGGAAGGGGYGGGAQGQGGGATFGGAQPAQGERIIVVLGDSHAHNSPRMQQLDAERTVDLAFGGEGVTNR